MAKPMAMSRLELGRLDIKKLANKRVIEHSKMNPLGSVGAMRSEIRAKRRTPPPRHQRTV